MGEDFIEEVRASKARMRRPRHGASSTFLSWRRMGGPESCSFVFSCESLKESLSTGELESLFSTLNLSQFSRTGIANSRGSLHSPWLPLITRVIEFGDSFFRWRMEWNGHSPAWVSFLKLTMSSQGHFKSVPSTSHWSVTATMEPNKADTAVLVTFPVAMRKWRTKPI